MQNTDPPEEEMQNTGDVGRMVGISGSEGPASPVGRPSLGAPNQPSLDTNPPNSFPPSFWVATPPDSPAEKVDLGCSSAVPAADTDCVICFNRYSLSRLPKLLACQHLFCAVCLKLILSNDGKTWEIVCPICRKASSVFGGLICSLRDKEQAVPEPLPNPGWNAEGLFPLDARRGKPLARGTFHVNPDDGGSSSDNVRVAAKRLVFLLLLSALLVALILPILDQGLLKWAICIAMGLGLALAGVLCFNPKWRCGSLCGSLPSWRMRASHITSVAESSPHCNY
ncbi:E3 ubiquitin-protein ligase RNF186-like [Podarcis raffonei]|uniref:E3 ubiquitin-protein ligase RNF186-like n=1 Tax=Podarcis raffonei TaxID=65483 RepID=UPI0023293B4C|nr:E3 ubiquitin-protein ligase RNF186-like [Podarcis raffonei]